MVAYGTKKKNTADNQKLIMFYGNFSKEKKREKGDRGWRYNVYVQMSAASGKSGWCDLHDKNPLPITLTVVYSSDGANRKN